MKSSLSIYEGIGDELLACRPEGLFRYLNGPSLFRLGSHLDGQPLVLSTLLHGNETSGYLAIQRLLQNPKPLTRPLWVVLGNIEAARFGQRISPGGEDFNRIWRPDYQGSQRWASELMGLLTEVKPYAVIDIHNNTGKNPFYGCASRLTPSHLALSHAFSPHIVYFTQPDSTLSVNAARLAPSATLECGKSGSAVECLVPYVRAVLSSRELTALAPPPERLYHTIARIKVPENQGISFAASDSQPFCFRSDLDELNFTELAPGELLGTYQGDARLMVDCIGNHTRAEHLLDYVDGKIVVGEPVVPAMFTLDKEIIFQDCLGYLMEGLSLHEAKSMFPQ